MLSTVVPIVALAAATNAAETYNIYASVIFQRTGFRTPYLDGQANVTVLTNIGSGQSSVAGAFVRAHYNGSAGQEIQGLDLTIPNPLQLFALATSDVGEFPIQSGNAFLQSLFPPLAVSNETAAVLDPTNVVFDGIYVPSAGGAQYPIMTTAGSDDPYSIYIDGSTSCPAWINFYSSYQAYVSAEPASDLTTLYTSVGAALGDAVVIAKEYNSANAYLIYDYLNYQEQYNATFHQTLTTGAFLQDDVYDKIRYASDASLNALYMNATANISTIAGAGLASLIFETLNSNIAAQGQENKLSTFFGDFQPLMSLFALTGLSTYDAVFTGLPGYGSLAVFELVAPTSAPLTNSTSAIDGSTLTYPSSLEDLYVRFSFANGTNLDVTNSVDLVQYPLFATPGTSADTLLTWAAFEQLIVDVALPSAAEWCQLCDAWETSVFCLAFNNTAWQDLERTTSSTIHPAVAGVIGALAALATTALAALFLVFIAGVGLTRKNKPVWARKSGSVTLRGSPSGFKIHKDPSDADLTIAKSGAAVGVAARGFDKDTDAGGKERVGSWELRDAPGGPAPGYGTIDGAAAAAAGGPGLRPSMDGAGRAAGGRETWVGEGAGFPVSGRSSLDAGGRPATPHERV